MTGPQSWKNSVNPCANWASQAAILLAFMTAQAAAESIWVEGENPAKRDVVKHGWYDNVRRDALSENDWISHYHRDKPGEAKYAIKIEESGEFVLWVRANVLHAELSYQVDDGEYQQINLKKNKRGEMMISPKPDHRSLAWVKAASLQLDSGQHTVRFKFHSKLANHGGIDCFCLSSDGFVPSGIRKPSEVKPAGPDSWFPVVFEDDAFSAKSVIDQSAAIAAPAGQHGFLKRAGKDLKFEQQSQPVRFWGCGANLNASQTRPQQTTRIRYLRKHGVNMIRQHSVFGFLGPLENGEFNAQKIDQFDWWFAELKKHGIYSTWSVFYPLVISADDGYDPELFAELPRRGQGASTSGLVNLERKLQELQFKYVRKLLEHKNKYTGLRYVDDPALAVLEIQNEDCVFWHGPLNDLAQGKKFPKHSRRMRERFGEWVKQKYQTDAALKKAWGRLRRGESIEQANPELGLFGAWQLAADGPQPNKAERSRAGDFIEFLTELQRGFYARREKNVRDLGFQGVTVSTAWRSGGPAADPANLYCDTACDMIDRHNYFGGGAGGHSIKAGKVKGGTHLAQPGGGLLSIGMYQVEDRPFSVTEWTSLPPNRYKLEAAPLMAFYGLGLQGWDASYHFLNSRTRLGDGWPNLSSYVTDTPHYIGQFPALSFALRHGHIEEAPVAAARRLEVDQLFEGVDVLQQDFTGGGYDDKQLKGNLATPTAVLAIGRVTVAFDGGPSKKVDWKQYWDRDQKVVRSLTGQLEWDYGRERVTLRTDKTKAILGRLHDDSVDLGGVEVQARTPFVSLIFTPLDNRHLADSRRILITALARDKQTGTQYASDSELSQIGTPPLLMEPVQATIRFTGGAKQVNVLDVYGVPTGKTVPVDETTITIDGRYQTYYYEVVR